jgi:hypothetical protein
MSSILSLIESYVTPFFRMNVVFKATSQLPTRSHGVERDAASCEGLEEQRCSAIYPVQAQKEGSKYSNQNSRCREKRHDRGSTAVQMREEKPLVVKTAEQ